MNRDPEGREVKFLKNYANLEGAKVLEIGCGNGILTRQYAEAAQSVVAVDPKLAELHTANDIKSAQFANAQAENLPFADESFDVAIFSSSL
jgi:ubiquinone/menaquinone biosynthesis C-methylase UbiE